MFLEHLPYLRPPVNATPRRPPHSHDAGHLTPLMSQLRGFTGDVPADGIQVGHLLEEVQGLTESTGSSKRRCSRDWRQSKTGIEQRRSGKLK